MLSSREMCREIARSIGDKTGIFAACDRVLTKGETAYVVVVERESLEISAGGSQVERKITFSVSAFGEDGMGMIDRLYGVLLPYFRALGRCFTIEQCDVARKDGAYVFEWSILFCDTLEKSTGLLPAMEVVKIELV